MAKAKKKATKAMKKKVKARKATVAVTQAEIDEMARRMARESATPEHFAEVERAVGRKSERYLKLCIVDFALDSAPAEYFSLSDADRAKVRKALNRVV